jgi:hypothetical protein
MGTRPAWGNSVFRSGQDNIKAPFAGARFGETDGAQVTTITSPELHQGNRAPADPFLLYRESVRREMKIHRFRRIFHSFFRTLIL